MESFAPIINDNTKILVIGTMPSEESLIQQKYYAHPRNAFWKIVSTVFYEDKIFESYEDAKNILLKNNIGLWDSLKCCEREGGSLDKYIKNETPNDFQFLLNKYSNVKRLLFNGAKSFDFFEKYHKMLLINYEYCIMPSTSPANAKISVDEKTKLWNKKLIF